MKRLGQPGHTGQGKEFPLKAFNFTCPGCEVFSQHLSQYLYFTLCFPTFPLLRIPTLPLFLSSYLLLLNICTEVLPFSHSFSELCILLALFLCSVVFQSLPSLSNMNTSILNEITFPLKKNLSMNVLVVTTSFHQ